MIRAWCCAPEECTEADVKKHFNAMLDKIGIKMVFAHSECMLPTTLSQSADEIDEAEQLHPTGNNFPLQPDSFYSYTPLVGTPSKTRHPIIPLLEKKPTKINPIVISIPCSLPSEKDYKDLPIEVYKHLIFHDEVSDKEIGWYNRTTNIIWMSDVLHCVENSKKILPAIVNPIIEYNRYGRINEMLTIGADPEFEIISEHGDFIEANRLFGNAGQESTGQEIGCDGVASTGEIRPKPSTNPLGLTRNIKRLVRQINSMQCMSGNKIWVGGGVNVTTGGHIHLGMQNMSPQLRETLYELVAEPVLIFQSDRRKQGEQGNWTKGASGNVREQPHGCEWRPLPSFIINEEITAAVLSTVYAIAKSYKFKEYRRSRVGKAIPADYVEIPLYPVFKQQIDKFVETFVELKDKFTFQKKDIFTEWGVPRIRKDFTVDIMTQCDWLSEYFTPVNVNLKRPVKLEIRFTGDGISTFGIGAEKLEDLKQFAEKHYLPTIAVNEKLPKGQDRPLICLPQPWYFMTGRTLFCEDFKIILKNIILQLGRK